MYSTHGFESKDELVNRYTPLVKRIALHLAGRLPPNVQLDDLIQSGLIGLLDAAAHYDERQGASFETYATIRVRGAMLDEVRRQDWVPKSVHRKSREIAQAVQQLEHRLGRAASDKEIATAMGMPLDEYHQALQDASAARCVSVEDLGSEDTVFTDSVASDEPLPFERTRDERFAKKLADAIASLPEREGLVLALYYDRGLNLKEVGAILGVGESRVSQLMSQAHARLRARLSDWIED